MIGAWRVARGRQSHEAQVLAHGQAFRIGRDVAHVIGLAWALEGQQGLEFGVVRKALRIRGGNRAALVVEFVLALSGLVQLARDAVPVGEQQGTDVDDDAPPFGILADDIAGPEHRFGERLAHAQCFVRILRDRAKARVVLDQQHALAGPTELDQMRTAALAAIEAYVVRADRPGQGADQQERLIEFAEAEQHASPRRIAMDIEESGHVLHVVRRGGDVLRRRRFGVIGLRRQCAHAEQHGKHRARHLDEWPH